ncbi:MAG: RdgB/HAM1 family non-canonical purine NTP pyrophosphatase [Bacilli bacterium]|nr:RdgB/HAM1 family non-canonical purine NTP pyrophosphatase [Bacilli bacterium]
MKTLEIVIATNNPNKVEEYRQMFASISNIKLFSLKDENIHIEIEENGKTFKENSLIKAETISKFTNKFVLADDSGLEIEALDNFPGIYSARFMEGRPYKEKWAAIFEMLKNKENKNAQFHCAITFITPTKEKYVFEGIEKGYITEKIEGENGFGYDPIFFSNSLNKTFGNATEEEKNAVSHRGKAFSQLLEFIKNNFKN